MAELEKKEVYICNQTPNIEDDEIDLRELFATIWKYKNFIAIFTFIVILLAGIYAFMKTPIYELTSDIQVGYNANANANANAKSYFIEPNNLVVYLKNNYTFKDKLPIIKISKLKHSKDIIEIKIDDISNEKAKEWLNKILSAIHNQEKVKIDKFKNYINNQISILNQQKKESKNSIKLLQEKLKNSKAFQTIDVLNKSILNYQNQLATINLNILDYKYKLNNIIKTHIIGKIQINDYPIKPKKKLIIIVAFITGFILAIFLVFFIEFIKGIKEKEASEQSD